MALLTAEDVLNKAFSKTKYREGFDQDEVDDYLDEVAHAIQTLTAERDQLAARLEEALSANPAGAQGAPATTQAPAPSSTPMGDAQTPTAMLAMAQKLHDEYVTSAQEEKDRIVSEAQAKAKELVETAEREATDKARQASEQAERERADLERKIDDLRRFERDYRSRLKTYLENLIGDLDHSTSTGSTPSGEHTV